MGEVAEQERRKFLWLDNEKKIRIPRPHKRLRESYIAGYVLRSILKRPRFDKTTMKSSSSGFTDYQESFPELIITREEVQVWLGDHKIFTTKW